MMKDTYIRSIGALVLSTLSLLSASATNYYTHANDTISRELVNNESMYPRKQAQATSRHSTVVARKAKTY